MASKSKAKKKTVKEKEIPLRPNPETLRKGQRFRGPVWHLGARWRDRELTYIGKKTLGSQGYIHLAKDDQGNVYGHSGGIWYLRKDG